MKNLLELMSCTDQASPTADTSLDRQLGGFRRRTYEGALCLPSTKQVVCRAVGFVTLL